VPQPHVSFLRRVLNTVATVPAGATTAIVTVAATGAMGSRPSKPRPLFEGAAPAPSFSAASSSRPPARVARVTTPKPAPRAERVAVPAASTPAPPVAAPVVPAAAASAPEPPVLEVEVETVTEGP
jgi:hypothetical protein